MSGFSKELCLDIQGDQTFYEFTERLNYPKFANDWY